MTKSKKGGGVKETFTGIMDTMENFFTENVLNKTNNNHNKNKNKKDVAIKEPINTEDSLNDHHNHYKSLESM